MVKRKQPKETLGNMADEDYDSDDPGVIYPDDGGPPRILRSSEVERMITGSERDRFLAEYQRDDEPTATGQGAAAPADNAGLQTSATGSGADEAGQLAPPADNAGAKEAASKAAKPKVHADNAGSKGAATPAASHSSGSSSSKSRSASSSRRRPYVPKPQSAEQQPPEAKPKAKKEKTPKAKPSAATKTPVQSSAPPTPAELAALEQKFTIEEAIRLLNEPPSAQTDAEFRQEIVHFWETWCEINRKTEGTTPMPWSNVWKKHKLGEHLYQRYPKFSLGIITGTFNRQVAAKKAAASATTTEASTSSGSTSATTTADQTTSAEASSSAEAPVEQPPPPVPQPQSEVSSTTDAEMTETAAPAAADEPMPLLTQKDLEILNNPEDVEQHVDDFLSNKFEMLLDENELEEDLNPEPTPQPADNAGAEGVPSAGAADNAARASGIAGPAVQVPSIPPPPPPRAASSSQSEAEDRGRQQSAKRSGQHTADSREPPAQRIRRHISLSPDRLSPGIERHRRTHKNSAKSLTPILDPRVCKEFAAQQTQIDEPFTPWTQEFRSAETEYLGYVNAFQAPWTYLPQTAYEPRPLRQASHRLGSVTFDQVMKEEIRLPNRYVLGHSFGVEPKLHKMVTTATREYLTFIAKQKYWEPSPGVKLRVVSIGPTGYDLTDCVDYSQEFVDQSLALARLARAADEGGKCLSLRIDSDNGTEIDLHEAAREVLRHVSFKQTTPIYLQEHQASYKDLCAWLTEFPNTVISFDFWYLSHLDDVAENVKATPTVPIYAKAVGILEFLKLAPLKNLAIQSGAYSLKGDSTPRHPHELKVAADLLKRLTGTSATVYLEQTAINAVRIYQLNDQLLDRAYCTGDRRQQPRCTIENLSRTLDTKMLSLNLAQAPRADQDQEPSGRHSSAGLPADNAGGQPGAGAEGLVVPSARSKSASRSPRDRSPRDPKDKGRKARSPVKRDKKKAKAEKPAKDTKSTKQRSRRSSSLSSSSSGSSSSGTSSKPAAAERKAKETATRKRRSKTPEKHRSRSRSRSPTRPSSASRSRQSSYRTESASRRSEDDHRHSSRHSYSRGRRYYEFDLRTDEERRRDDDRWRTHRRGDDRHGEDRQRKERKDRREREDRKSPDPNAPTSSRDASTKRRDERHQSSSSRGSSPPEPTVKSQVFVKPHPPKKARDPIRAPIPDKPGSRASSQASSRASTSTQRSTASQLKGRVMIPEAVASADNAGAPNQAVQRTHRQPADNAGAVQPLQCTARDDLLKPHPLPPRWPVRPTEEEIEQHVEGYFSQDVDPATQLCPFYIRDFASMPIDPPQQDSFSVPPGQSWEPSQRCSCSGEDTNFHPTIEQGNYIPIRRWRAHNAFKGPGNDEKLNAVGNMKIFTLGHMILVTWCSCLKGKDNRVADVIEFLHQALQSFDFEQEIPALLAAFQELMVTEDTRSKWPAFKDAKIAALRWSGCCPDAFKYIFDRLAGPIDWATQWLQGPAVPDDCLVSVRDTIIARAEEMFNELRHVLYRQYGLRHINAALKFEDYVWRRCDDDQNRESHLDGVCINTHTIVFAEASIVEAFGSGLQDSVRMLKVPNGNSDAIRSAILKYFPGPAVRRVVFWIGHQFIVEDNHDDFNQLIMELTHIYATYPSYLEQFVVLPTYARTHNDVWASQVLRLVVDRQDSVPFARVALYPVDLQYYEWNSRLGAVAVWPPSFNLTEDGRFRHNGTVNGRKRFLKEHHSLDLWKPVTKVTKSKEPPAIDYSAIASARTKAADNAASAMKPTTSANTAATSKTSVGPSSAADNAARGTTQPSSSAAQPLSVDTSTFDIPGLAPIFSNAVNAFLQRQARDFQAFQQSLLDQLADEQAAAATSQPKEPKSRHKDQKHDRRK